MNSIADAFSSLKKEIGTKAQLVAVSKYSPASDVERAYEWGQRDFGENRVPDLLAKSEELSHLSDIRWHFIGHLQSNKLSKLLQVKNLVSIHGLDSLGLIEKLVDALRKRKNDQLIECFVQVNTSGEDEKYGLENYEEVLEASKMLKKAEENDLLIFRGLMTMGKIRTDNQQLDARRCFKDLGSLRDKLSSQLDKKLDLNMGMSSDYGIALEEGADVIRVGSKLFR